MKKLKNITVLYNETEDKDYAADVDTEVSAKEITDVLSQKYQVELLEITPGSLNKIKKIKSDLVFNLSEWTGQNFIYEVEALKILEKMGLPFTGSGAKAYANNSNKLIMKKLMHKYHISTPAENNFNFPLIVKPTLEHCGLGVSQMSVVKNKTELAKQTKFIQDTYKQPALVEEFIDGRELHVTVLEKNCQPWVLPPAEVVFKNENNYQKILSYEGKWHEDSEEYAKSWMTLAKLSETQLISVGDIAKKTYKYLGGCDYPRLDIRLRDDEIFVLEININPGIDFSLESGFGVSGRAAGFDYLSILSHICENAYSRFLTSAHDTSAI